MEVRAGTSREGLNCFSLCRPWKNGGYQLAFHYLNGLLSHTTQGHLPRGTTAHSELGPPNQSLIWKVMPKAYLEENLMEAFSPLRSPFQSNLFDRWCQQNWVSTCRRMKLEPYFSHCTKIKFKWIKDFNITLPQK